MDQTKPGHSHSDFGVLGGQDAYLPQMLDLDELELTPKEPFFDSQMYEELIRANVLPFVSDQISDHGCAPAIVLQAADLPFGYAPDLNPPTSVQGPEYLFPLVQATEPYSWLSPTPSMTSGTTARSMMDAQHGDFEMFANMEFSSMDDPVFEPLSHTMEDIKPTMVLDTTYLGVSRSRSVKRGPVEIDRTECLEPPLLTRKRSRSVEGGYPCSLPTCGRVFNRACDEHKHFKNKHSSTNDKPYGCPHSPCRKRFAYPKDVKRHVRQMHTNVLVSPVTPVTPHSAVEEMQEWNDQQVYHFRQASQFAQQSRPQPPKPRRRSLSTSLKTVVSMLSSLKLWQNPIEEGEQIDAEKFILVTQDHHSYHKVYLAGVDTAERLLEEIAAVFGNSLDHPHGALVRHCLGKGRLGKNLAGKQLMAAVSKATSVGKNLELFFSPIQQV
ncbi:hypothetical protein TI39_contig314g00008 [Zymoseptoria brevis]|uniref:C2H2-type domain-containing protein n=1 Tax=Zymoseptoria brevis TaxID=1047168 RepID=A0A0F4GTL1_9PEZI|nr:hypothetical protein TI39_contig314g00008 [Zymoseptoria brevis]